MKTVVRRLAYAALGLAFARVVAAALAMRVPVAAMREVVELVEIEAREPVEAVELAAASLDPATRDAAPPAASTPARRPPTLAVLLARGADF